MEELKRITQEELNEILKDYHKEDTSFIQSFELSDSNLSGLTIQPQTISKFTDNGISFTTLDTPPLNLYCANFSNVDFKGAIFYNVDLSYARFENCNLEHAQFIKCDLVETRFYGSDLTAIEISSSCTHIGHIDFSNTKGLRNSSDFLKETFESTEEGIIVYKVFNTMYEQNPNWELEKGSVITETVNWDRLNTCGCGINVAPLWWVKDAIDEGALENDEDEYYIWKLLIRWEWLSDVVVPLYTDGKIRCGKAELVEVAEVYKPDYFEEDNDYDEFKRTVD